MNVTTKAYQDRIEYVIQNPIKILEEIASLKALSVTNILIDIVPGDGSGQEVYAKSVADVVELLSRLSEKAEDADSLKSQLEAEKASALSYRDEAIAAQKQLAECKKDAKRLMHIHNHFDVLVTFDEWRIELDTEIVANRKRNQSDK